MKSRLVRKSAFGLVLLFGAPLLAIPNEVPVGVAKIDITPTHPTVLAGYGGRTTEHDGVDRRIFARALAIGGERPVLLLAVENCGVPASLTEVIKARLKKKAGVDPSHVAIASTHTHSAPNLVGYARILWADRTTPEQAERQQRYTDWFAEKVVEAGVRALAARSPATLAWTQGRVEFGGNRRIMVDGSWRGFGLQHGAPVDHSLPLLVARSPNGEIRAIWTTYACHCTTTGARNRICGDWAGYASDTIESRHAKSVALLTIGCGADVGPQPSGTLAVAEQHGRAIADEVDRCLDGKLEPLARAPKAVASPVDLPLAKPRPRAEFERIAEANNSFDGRHARAMLATLDAGKPLAAHVKLPVSSWSFDDDLAIVFLGGEVVVDYAVRLKRELDWRRLWINAWVDDVPCYIVSKRVLAEGGYEPGFSMIYYEKPSSFAPAVEDTLVRAVHGVVPDVFNATEDQPPRPYHKPTPVAEPRFPGRPKLSDAVRAELRKRVVGTAESLREGKVEGLTLKEFSRALDASVDGFDGLLKNDGAEDTWFEFSGSRKRRPYIRQQRVGDTLSWKTAPVREAPSSKTVTFAFFGGIGWVSQAKTAGFELSAGGESIPFDVTLSPAGWSGTRGARLLYFPTWTSDTDSGGVFFLTVPRTKLSVGKPCEITVRSVGHGSLRWFSVDVYRDAVEIAKETLQFSTAPR